jgi:hypothetical protein
MDAARRAKPEAKSTAPSFAPRATPSQRLRSVLTALGDALGRGYHVEFDVAVRVFDEEQERTLPLLSTGLSTTEGKEPYRTWNDCTSQRYVADGDILVVPHDRCPRCWETWDFKFVVATLRLASMIFSTRSRRLVFGMGVSFLWDTLALYNLTMGAGPMPIEPTTVVWRTREADNTPAQ